MYQICYFDNVVIRQQQLKEIIDRSIQLKPSTARTVTGTGTNGPVFFPELAANKLLSVDAAGTSLIMTSEIGVLSNANFLGLWIKQFTLNFLEIFNIFSLSESTIILSIFFDFNADLIVQAIKGISFNFNIFLFLSPLLPDLAGIKASILLFLVKII